MSGSTSNENSSDITVTKKSDVKSNSIDSDSSHGGDVC